MMRVTHFTSFNIFVFLFCRAFAYRVDISWSWYALTLAWIGLLSLAVVGWHTRRSTAVNPAEALRDE